MWLPRFARVLQRFGANCRALYPAGGVLGRLLRTLLDAEGVAGIALEIASETRESFTVLERSDLLGVGRDAALDGGASRQRRETEDNEAQAQKTEHSQPAFRWLRASDIRRDRGSKPRYPRKQRVDIDTEVLPGENVPMEDARRLVADPYLVYRVV